MLIPRMLEPSQFTSEFLDIFLRYNKYIVVDD